MGLWCCVAPVGLSKARGTEKLGSESWALGTKWISCQTVYLYMESRNRERERGYC